MFTNLSAEVLALFLALVSGVFMALQGSLNAALSKVVGLWETALVVHITGTALVAILLFVLRLGRQQHIFYSAQAPWYLYLGGVIGVLIIYLVMASIPRVGVANATTAIIVGQVLTAIVIDHFGLFGLAEITCGWNQLLGLGLLATGAWLLLK